MSKIRTELSEKNPYQIPKHRYLELKHFCLQYPDWKRQLAILEPPFSSEFLIRFQKASGHSNPTEKLALIRAVLSENVELVEETAKEADRDIYKWLLYGVTHDVGFDYLKTVMAIPCERDMYYSRYRKFFWLLDKNRT